MTRNGVRADLGIPGIEFVLSVWGPLRFRCGLGLGPITGW